MRRVGLVLLLALAAAGCGGGSAATRSNGGIAGVWQRADGQMLPASEVAVNVSYLDLAADGSGTLYGDFGGGVLTCAPLIYAEITGNTMRLDISSYFSHLTYTWTRSGSNLTLTSPGGNVIHFTRVAAVPATSVCGTAQAGTSFAIPSAPESFTGLVGAGGYLWYSNNATTLLSVTSAGTPGPTYASVYPYRDVLAAQGADFWFHTAAGHDNALARYTTAGAQVDVFDLLYDFTHDYAIRTAAVDPVSGHIWLFARDTQSPAAYLLEMDASGEPDQILSLTQFDGPIDSFTWHQGELWALTGYGAYTSIVRMDAVNATAVQTFLLKPDGRFYQDIADLNGQLYLLAQPDDTFPLGAISPVTVTP